MGVPKKKISSREALVCFICEEEEARTAGMCLRCYNRDYYHRRLDHGASYFKGYRERAEFSLKFADAVSPHQEKKRHLRAVK